MNPLDIIDTEPMRLSARTLVGRLRAEEYKEGDMLGARGPVLDDIQATDAVLAFARQFGAKPCDHKFVDSTNCLKCGWTPQRSEVTA